MQRFAVSLSVLKPQRKMLLQHNTFELIQNWIAEFCSSWFTPWHLGRNWTRYPGKRLSFESGSHSILVLVCFRNKNTSDPNEMPTVVEFWRTLNQWLLKGFVAQQELKTFKNPQIKQIMVMLVQFNTSYSFHIKTLGSSASKLVQSNLSAGGDKYWWQLNSSFKNSNENQTAKISVQRFGKVYYFSPRAKNYKNIVFYNTLFVY